MASKRRIMFYQNKKQEPTEIGTFKLPPFCDSPVQPGSPEDLITGPVSMRNKTVSVVLRWKPPASDVPVNRYLVYWSRRISSDQVPPEQGSVMMHQKSVSHLESYILQHPPISLGHPRLTSGLRTETASNTAKTLKPSQYIIQWTGASGVGYFLWCHSWVSLIFCHVE
ncbi:hypothetical protein AAG570_002452 [Ranatra chinensis]|uniref:Fibronectin type-III domain-containing protein n=1 Tax=Ranatra chinensis TaxID=642074 RepID=A0ABD0YLP9_9HEMI